MSKVILSLIILVMTILGATASYFLKKASAEKGIAAMLKKYNIYLGGILYVIAALLNVYVLRFMDYSVVLPLTSITYIWTMLIAYWFLKERITRRKIVGVFCIVVGVCILVM